MRPEVKDMYAAVKAYYEGYDEIIRLLRAGGVKSPTPKMKATMTGEYLDFATRSVKPGRFVRGEAQVDGYAVGAQTPTRIPITICENQSKLKVFDSETGKQKKLDVSGLLVREVEAVKGSDGVWRISREIGSSRFVEPEDWKEQPCMATTDRPA